MLPTNSRACTLVPQEEDSELLDEPTSSGKDASTVAAPAPSPSVGGKMPGEEGSTDAERVRLSLSSRSRAVVTFVLYRSVSSDVSGLASAMIPRICEVEALEHNTLQEVMGETLRLCWTPWGGMGGILFINVCIAHRGWGGGGEIVH